MLLTLCKKLLKICIPKRLHDNICGDLEEEYQQLSANNEHNHAELWLVKHTLLTCSRFIFTPNNFLAALVTFFSLALFSSMAIGIIWLSTADEFIGFPTDFWQEFNNHSHIVFFEPAFWQYAPTALSKGMSFGLWIDGPALVYSIITLTIFSLIDRKKELTAKVYFKIAIPLMLLPYLWGSIQFMLYQKPMIETGPLIATMWLSILYMVLPIGFTVVKKVQARHQEL